MGKGDNKPRGRMSAYAFFVRTCREEHKKKHPDEAVVFAEFSKRCGERWKTMSEKEKKRFQQMAEKDKKRYESEMANYVPAEGGEVVAKKRKAKDPNAPKRNLSAFFCFSKDERPKIKKSLPDSTLGDVAKELGRRWNECSPDTKSKYEALAAKDKARYQKEVNIYKKGQSYTGAAASSGSKTASKKAKPSTSKAATKKESDDESGEEEAESEEEDDDDEDDD